ncbi:MAG TPA: phenylalanine--tRNA ligase beta subunit-related protein [Thermoleophilaceae bacterium]|nr:phenylalanine--tRNA ligase beta subunit-related protein [Thermoleophilaceae bacterium]
MGDPVLEPGWVEGELAEELPGLGLWSARVQARSGRTPHSVRDRLRVMAGRITGGHVVHMRQDPVPWAYRVLWRKVGLDPDVDRPPAEAIAVERLRAGTLTSRNLLDDALVIATLETGVPVMAFDADRVGAELGLRTTARGESLGTSGRALSSRQIVVADREHVLATLDGDVAPDRGVSPATTAMVLTALAANGVPLIAVEEALWTVAEILQAQD